MGLYLTIFDDDEELDGVEVGSYADFDKLRSAVAKHVEGGMSGSLCPTLMLHSDSDGQWTPAESALLRHELVLIRNKFMLLPIEQLEGWKREVARAFALRPVSLYSCFFDVDGEPLLDRMIGLAELSVAKQLPILFQ